MRPTTTHVLESGDPAILNHAIVFNALSATLLPLDPNLGVSSQLVREAWNCQGLCPHWSRTARESLKLISGKGAPFPPPWASPCCRLAAVSLVYKIMFPKVWSLVQSRFRYLMWYGISPHFSPASSDGLQTHHHSHRLIVGATL